MVGYFNSELLTAHFGLDLTYPVIRDTNGELITTALEKHVAKFLYYNGSLVAYTSDTSGNDFTAPLISYDDACIGGSFLGSAVEVFNGDIAEYIGYNRKLTENERMAVEVYLNKKYSLY